MTDDCSGGTQQGFSAGTGKEAGRRRLLSAAGKPAQLRPQPLKPAVVAGPPL